MIRSARSSDLPAVLAMVRKLHVSTRQMAPFDDDMTMRTLLHLMTGSRSLLAVSEVGERLNGFVAATVAYGSVSTVPFAQEHGWWGEGGCGLRLLKHYEKWAKGEGCSFARMCTPPHNEMAATILRKCGYVHAESVWVKAI